MCLCLRVATCIIIIILTSIPYVHMGLLNAATNLAPSSLDPWSSTGSHDTCSVMSGIPLLLLRHLIITPGRLGTGLELVVWCHMSMHVPVCSL